MKALVFVAALVASPLAAEEVSSANGAVLRGIDKLSGALVDVTIPSGGTASVFRLDVSMTDCRYPSADPSSNAYAYLTIIDPVGQGAVFQGWMIAASPALSALDHPRYDVWVLRCTTS